ncbi:MAG: MFS transporter [Ktedonobacteraceae bacterium]
MEPTGTGQIQTTTGVNPITTEAISMEPQLRPSHPSRFALWRNRDYMLLWSGQVVSNVGSQVSMLAFPLLILALTRSPALAGFAGALRALPYLLFSLPAGAIVDRWDRKRVMIICDTGRALAMVSIPIALVLGHLTVIQLFVVTAVEGTLYVFFNISEAASLPRVVPKILLPEATAQNMATDGITVLLGPPIGGFLYQLSPVIPFLGDAISYGCSVLSLFFIKTNFQEKRVAARRKLWIEIHEGLHWLWQHPLIRFMAILTGGSNLTSAGFTLIIIVLAQHMHASSFTIGLIFAIGGIGAIVGAIIGPSLQKRLSFGTAIISTTWVMSLTMPLYIIAPNVMMIGVISAVAFVAGPVYNVVQFSYRSAIIPDELQGRVNSVFRLIAFGGQPLGYALTGLLIQNIGVTRTLLLDSVVMRVGAVAVTLNTHVRHAQPLR